MILNDPTAMSVLKSIYQAAAGPSDLIVQRADVAKFTRIDPAAVHNAIDALLEAKLLLLGATNGQLCLSGAGNACVERFVQWREERVA